MITRTSRQDYAKMWRAAIQPRDLRSLSLFNTYTSLPQDWIHELVSPDVTIWRTRLRLRLLSANPNRLFDKPEAQFKRSDNPNNYTLIYSRSAKGANLLEQHGQHVVPKSLTND